MPQRRARSSQGGFSFIEVLIGIVILGIVAGGVFMGFAASSAQIAKGRLDTVASKMANGRLDTIREMDYDDVGIIGGNPVGVLKAAESAVVSGITYRVETDVTYVDDPTPGRSRSYINYKRIVVTVTPQVASGRPVTVVSQMAPPNVAAIRGKATAIINVIDAFTLQPLAGARVRLFGSTSPERIGMTDAQGKVVFGGLDPSNPVLTSPQHWYKATATFADYATDPTSGPDTVQQSLAASQAWEGTIKLYRPATITVRVLDAATGALVTERAQAGIALPATAGGLSQSFVGYTGEFAVDRIQGADIRPSSENTTVRVAADCYDAVPPLTARVPEGYPDNPNQVFTATLKRTARTARLKVSVVTSTTGAPVPGATVQVSGGDDARTDIPSRVTDANGYAEFCVPKTDSTPYTLSAVAPGYSDAGMTLLLPEGTVRSQVVRMGPTTKCVLQVRHRLGVGQLVRLVGVTVTFDEQTTVASTGYATFNPPNGTYSMQYVSGYTDGQPTWATATWTDGTAGAVPGNVKCPNTRGVPVIG